MVSLASHFVFRGKQSGEWCNGFFLISICFFFSGQDNWTKISFFLLNSNCLLNNIKSDFSTLKPGKTINPEKMSHILSHNSPILSYNLP